MRLLWMYTETQMHKCVYMCDMHVKSMKNKYYKNMHLLIYKEMLFSK